MYNIGPGDQCYLNVLRTIMNVHYELEWLSLTGLSSLVKSLWLIQEPTWKVLHLGTLQAYLQTKTRLERAAKDKRSSLLQTFIIYGHKHGLGASSIKLFITVIVDVS